MNKPRLSPVDWIFAGFNALAEVGPSALKAEVLARHLGTSKGSFYWHFADVATYHAAMMELWEQRAVSDIITDLEAVTDPRDRLRALAQATTYTPEGLVQGNQVEAAIRAWARSSETVCQAVKRVDAQRMAYLKELFASANIPTEPYTRITYATYIGLEELPSPNASAPIEMEGLIDLILSQFPAPT